jgi:hypothetical protein
VPFIDDRLLFGYIHATLSEELFITFFPTHEGAPGFISPFLQIVPYEVADPIATVQRSLVGRYYWLVCSLGFTTAAENLLKIGSRINGWWEHYEIAIVSAAFLAATQHEVLEVLRLFLPRDRRYTFYRDLHRYAAQVAREKDVPMGVRNCKGKSRSHGLPEDSLPRNQSCNIEAGDESNNDTRSSRSWGYGAMTDEYLSRENVRVKKYHSHEFDNHDSATRKETLLKYALFQKECLLIKDAAKEIEKYLHRSDTDRAEQADVVEVVQSVVEFAVAQRGAYIDPESLSPFREPAQSIHTDWTASFHENLFPFMEPGQSELRNDPWNYAMTPGGVRSMSMVSRETGQADAAAPSPDSLD